MKIKFSPYVLFVSALICVSTASHAAQTVSSSSLRFKQFPVEVYHGRMKTPRGFHKGSEGYWIDEAGKPALSPRVNFAGEYFLATHSCGTCCRYYTLDSLRTGKAVQDAQMFDAGDPSPTTKNGHAYVSVLYYKRNSSMLIAQYALDPCGPDNHNECRQRYFVLSGGRIRAISKTLPHCTNEGAEQD